MNIINIFLSIRPKTLLISLSPVLLALSMSAHLNNELNFPLAVLTIFCVLFMQIISNLSNDYADFVTGVDTDERKGPQRAIQSGRLSLKQLKFLIIFFSILALGTGIYLSFEVGQELFLIGILSLLTAFAYSMGPFPLSKNGLGEVCAFIFFGPVAIYGTSLIQETALDVNLLILSILPGCFASMIMLINNIRDFNEDHANSKRTLSVIFGLKFSNILFKLILLLSVFPSVYFAQKIDTLFLLTLFPYLKMLRRWFGLQSMQASELNSLLGDTAKTLIVITFLFLILLIYK